jgi:hypothetical protein
MQYFICLSRVMLGTVMVNPIQVRGGRNHLNPPTAPDTDVYNFIKRTQNGSVNQVWPFCAH